MTSPSSPSGPSGPSGRSPAAGANLSALRDHNAALVLGLLRESPASRVELAARSGLTPQAISKIATRLLGEGLITEAGRGGAPTATGGKPRTLLRLRPDAAGAVGIQLDSDQLTVAVVDLSGEIRHSRTEPFDAAEGPDRGADRIAALARESAAATPSLTRVLGVGIGSRGPLDHAAGVLHHPTGLPGWDRFALRAALADRLGGLPVAVDKDTNAAALGEPAPAGSSLAYLHLAQGLGAGLLLDGSLYRGSRTNAGEFGHQTVQLDGPACACGNRGCLEALVLSAEGPRESARLLGLGAANLVRLLDVDRVVLGGAAVLSAPGLYAAEVAAHLAESLPDPDWQRVTVSVTASGPLAVARGAAELVLGPVFGRRL